MPDKLQSYLWCCICGKIISTASINKGNWHAHVFLKFAVTITKEQAAPGPTEKRQGLHAI